MFNANTEAQAIIMSGMPGKVKPGGAPVTGEDGITRQLFLKDLARVGQFHKRSDGARVEIDAKMLARFESETNRAIAAGYKVPVPDGHDLTGSADRNRGYLKETFIDDDVLYGKIEAIGDDAIAAASRSHVSIFSPPKWRDSQGNDYEWPITHVALTTDPVICPQGEFVPIAASNGTIKADLIEPQPEQPKMYKDLQKALGVEVELTDDNAVEEVTKAIQAAQDAVPEAAATELSNVKAEVEKLKADKDAKGDAISLSNTERGLAKRLVGERADSLVKAGHITPAQRDQIVPMLCRDDAALAFSNDGGDCEAIKMLETFKANTAVKLGEQTGAQVIELSNPPAGVQTPTVDPEARKARITAAHS